MNKFEEIQKIALKEMRGEAIFQMLMPLLFLISGIIALASGKDATLPLIFFAANTSVSFAVLNRVYTDAFMKEFIKREEEKK